MLFSFSSFSLFSFSSFTFRLQPGLDFPLPMVSVLRNAYPYIPPHMSPNSSLPHTKIRTPPISIHLRLVLHDRAPLLPRYGKAAKVQVLLTSQPLTSVDPILYVVVPSHRYVILTPAAFTVLATVS